jgi:hypothetical protein
LAQVNPQVELKNGPVVLIGVPKIRIVVDVKDFSSDGHVAPRWFTEKDPSGRFVLRITATPHLQPFISFHATFVDRSVEKKLKNFEIRGLTSPQPDARGSTASRHASREAAGVDRVFESSVAAKIAGGDSGISPEPGHNLRNPNVFHCGRKMTVLPRSVARISSRRRLAKWRTLSKKSF